MFCFALVLWANLGRISFGAFFTPPENAGNVEKNQVRYNKGKQKSALYFKGKILFLFFLFSVLVFLSLASTSYCVV